MLVIVCVHSSVVLIVVLILVCGASRERRVLIFNKSDAKMVFCRKDRHIKSPRTYVSEGFIGDVSSRRALFGSGSFGFGGSGSGFGFSLGSGDFGFLFGYGFGLSFVLSLFFGQTCLSLLFLLVCF